MRVDKHTLSNIDSVKCNSLVINLNADFENRSLIGCVEYNSELLSDTNEFVLDTKSLRIEKVIIDESDNCSPFFLKSSEIEVFGSALHITLPSSKCTKGSNFITRIFYSTTPESTAIQWLSKDQTADENYPYLFTQCQAIHARSLLPCQDCPLAKMFYKATMTVPIWATCLMSAVEMKHHIVTAETETKTFFWEQKVAVPSYLIAIIIGHIESRDIGIRSRVWSEPSCVDSCAYEFAQAEDFIKHAEEIMGQEYVWRRYDIVSLPPSFPYGGTENPCLTFATPTLIAGDRSLADVIAHEIAHSWTGNLITNHTWEDFWLNEGWTMWLQRKIMTKIHQSNSFFDFDVSLGYNALQRSIDHYGTSHEFTKLIPNLTGIDPDDSASSVPYEKGFLLLLYLSTIVGHDHFEIFAKAYTQEFKYRTVTSDEFKLFFIQFFSTYKDVSCQLMKIDWDTWFHDTGMPNKPVLDTSLSLASFNLAEKWCTNTNIVFSKDDIAGWTSSQIVGMLECVDQLCSKRGKYLTLNDLKQMRSIYYFENTKNSEIRFRYQILCIHAEASFILRDVETFLKEQGRMKFIRPLYRDLNKSMFGNVAARRIFSECKNSYHPIARKMVSRDFEHAGASLFS